MRGRLVLIGSMVLALLAVALFVAPKPALAATCTKTSTGGNWNTSGTWSPSGVPGATDVVCINSGTVTLDTSTTVATLQITGTLTLGNNTTSRTITVTGDVTVNPGGTLDTINSAVTNQMNIGGDFTNASGNLVNFVRSTAGAVANVTFTKAGTQNLSSTGAGGFDFNSVTINSGSTLSVNSNVGTTLLTIETTLTVNGTIVLPNLVTVVSATSTLTAGASGLIQTADADGVSGGAATSFDTGWTTTSLNTNGTVQYNGTAQAVTGRTYQNLTISGSGTKTLGANATVNGALTIDSGAILDTGTNTVTASGTYNNSGQIRHTPATQSITANGVVTYTDGTGNPTAVITGTGTALGTTSGNSTAWMGGTDPYGSSCTPLTTEVSRTWQITPTTTATTTVKFYYRVSELNGLTPSALKIWRCGAGDAKWSLQGGTYISATGTTYNWIQSDAVRVGSTYVLASSGAPTAVTLSSFGAREIPDQIPARIALTWVTASEINTAGFNIYRSERAEGPYVRINAQLIPAAADPLVGGKYQYEDISAAPGKTYYYQVEDVELNGTSTRHPAVLVTVASASGLGNAGGALIGLGLGALAVAGAGFVILQKKRTG